MELKKRLTGSAKEELIKKMFRECFQTPSGRFALTFLVVESRAFSQALKVVSNLKSTYGVSEDYYLAQSDFGRKILSFLTQSQIAEIISSIITDETKEN